ncbi:MAG: VCBS repeat-containing protein [Bifidobacteriaceae bacterium]|nr:VCBS repeat-containing protein [Bifidobacteriaceae bacterium]
MSPLTAVSRSTRHTRRLAKAVAIGAVAALAATGLTAGVTTAPAQAATTTITGKLVPATGQTLPEMITLLYYQAKCSPTDRTTAIIPGGHGGGLHFDASQAFAIPDAITGQCYQLAFYGDFGSGYLRTIPTTWSSKWGHKQYVPAGTANAQFKVTYPSGTLSGTILHATGQVAQDVHLYYDQVDCTTHAQYSKPDWDWGYITLGDQLNPTTGQFSISVWPGRCYSIHADYNPDIGYSLPLPLRLDSQSDYRIYTTAGTGKKLVLGLTKGNYETFSLSPDLNGDKRGDVLAIDTVTGALHVHSTTTSGTLAKPYTVPVYTSLSGQRVFGPGDWSGDKINDVLTVDTQGRMWLYKGDGKGHLARAVQSGRGWSAYTIIPSGDLDGDRLNDLLAIDTAGKLWLYSGDGKGGFKPGRREVGHGWTGFDCYAAGDLNKDGRADILGVNSAGILYAYMGKGNGGFKAAQQVGKGWNKFTLAAGADLNGDGLADIVGRNDATGQLYFYRSKGAGQFAAAVQIGQAW